MGQWIASEKYVLPVKGEVWARALKKVVTDIYEDAGIALFGHVIVSRLGTDYMFCSADWNGIAGAKAAASAFTRMSGMYIINYFKFDGKRPGTVVVTLQEVQ